MMKIRDAQVDEAEALSRIAHMAKAHWGYTDADLANWVDDLTITPDTLQNRPTFVALVDGNAVGFCQLNFEASKADLEHLWVLPLHMGQGVGRALLTRALTAVTTEKYNDLWIDSDPGAAGFYASCGAQPVGEISAPITNDHNRKRPLFCLAVPQANTSVS
jgi:GNAT superfamily N-acetyltransferase